MSTFAKKMEVEYFEIREKFYNQNTTIREEERIVELEYILYKTKEMYIEIENRYDAEINKLQIETDDLIAKIKDTL